MIDLSELQVSRTATIQASPESLYGIISDVTRIGELSPVCKAAWWDEGAGPRVGAWFTGRNEVEGRDPWERHCEITAAEPGRAFSWITGGREEGTTEWSYRFTPVDGGGTEVEESWKILQYNERLASLDDEQILGIKANTESGIEATLENLARVAKA